MQNIITRRLIIGLWFLCSLSQAQEKTGTVRGVVVDTDSKAPLSGTNVLIMDSNLGAAADADGMFTISRVPVGNYTLQIHHIGYEPQRKTDIIVRSDRITTVDFELRMSTIEGQELIVTAGYFARTEEQPTSIVNFTHEEIRRAPGSAGDVSRILMGLPSIAKVNDQQNSLIVRGGSPSENGFIIDNIEIPNINHYPTQGASGGPIGLIHVDFIRDINFYAGGFPASHGDRLSSIMEIAFREGNRENIDAQLDLNFAGFGGVAEGPLGEHGSWLFSARRSYLDLLIKMADVGSTVAPRYGDVQGKLVVDVHPKHKLTFLGVFGDDHMESDADIARKNGMIVFGNQDIYERTSGVNWRALWNASGYSNTSLSLTSMKYEEDYFETNSGTHLLRNRSVERALKLRNVNHFRLGKKTRVGFGLEARQLLTDYDNSYAEYTDALGNTVPPFRIDDRMTGTKLGGFFNLSLSPNHRLTANLGGRYDYFTYNGNGGVSPRLSLSYRLSERSALNAAAGIFTQSLPLILLSQQEAFKDLKDPRAVHYVLGFEHLLAKDVKLTVEAYQKEYDHFPIDPTHPSLFVIDELVYRHGFFFNHDRLEDNGKARARGVELILQKKLAKNLYGMASGSYARSEYRGGDGVWRDRVYDNRWIFSVEGGYKPNNRWEFSMRWIYAGGTPYTPFDAAASETLQRAVLDEGRINEARYPDYHSLNLRLDKRFHFRRSNLIAYLSVWNVYNRKNVAQYFWNEIENREDVSYQWSMLPVFGLEYEF